MVVTYEKMSGSTNFTVLFQIKGDAACIVFNIKTACSQAKKHLMWNTPRIRAFLFSKFHKKNLKNLKMHNVKCLETSFI